MSLFAFLVAAIIGSNLSAAAQERARIAVERAQFLEEREAAEIQRQRGELAATLLASLSHDLKTPLTVVRMAVDNLRDELPTDEPARAGRRRRRRTEPPDAAVRRASWTWRASMPPPFRCSASGSTPADVVDAAMAHARHAVDGHALRVEADADHVVNIDARLAVGRAVAPAGECRPLLACRSRHRRRCAHRSADGVTVYGHRSRSRPRSRRDRSPVRAFLPRAAARSRPRPAPAWAWRSRAGC